MKPEEQRIAIAEACGYRNIALREDQDKDFDPVLTGFKNDNHFDEQIPDYLNSLNAMHKAMRKGLTGSEQLRTYEAHLLYLSPDYPTEATAAQRAEAFLRTIGKWEENSDES
jgi:hypothetical protein